MKQGGVSGANTLTGLAFEDRVDFLTLISGFSGYTVEKQDVGTDILFQGDLVACCFKKYEFYNWLDEQEVEWDSKISMPYGRNRL